MVFCEPYIGAAGVVLGFHPVVASGLCRGDHDVAAAAVTLDYRISRPASCHQ